MTQIINTGRFKYSGSFGIDSKIPEKDIQGLRGYSIGIWKSFFKKQGDFITFVDDKVVILKRFDKELPRFYIEFPRSTEDFMLEDSKKRVPLSYSIAKFMISGDVEIIGEPKIKEIDYGNAWEKIFHHLTGKSFAGIIGKFSGEINSWVLEESSKFNSKNKPEFFLNHYIKKRKDEKK